MTSHGETIPKRILPDWMHQLDYLLSSNININEQRPQLISYADKLIEQIVTGTTITQACLDKLNEPQNNHLRAACLHYDNLDTPTSIHDISLCTFELLHSMKLLMTDEGKLTIRNIANRTATEHLCTTKNAIAHLMNTKMSTGQRKTSFVHSSSIENDIASLLLHGKCMQEITPTDTTMLSECFPESFHQFRHRIDTACVKASQRCKNTNENIFIEMNDIDVFDKIENTYEEVEKSIPQEANKMSAANMTTDCSVSVTNEILSSSTENNDSDSDSDPSTSDTSRNEELTTQQCKKNASNVCKQTIHRRKKRKRKGRKSNFTTKERLPKEKYFEAFANFHEHLTELLCGSNGKHLDVLAAETRSHTNDNTRTNSTTTHISINVGENKKSHIWGCDNCFSQEFLDDVVPTINRLRFAEAFNGGKYDRKIRFVCERADTFFLVGKNKELIVGDLPSAFEQKIIDMGKFLFRQHNTYFLHNNLSENTPSL